MCYVIEEADEEYTWLKEMELEELLVISELEHNESNTILTEEKETDKEQFSSKIKAIGEL